MQEYTYIYGLVAQNDALKRKNVRYIGKAGDLADRLQRHREEGRHPGFNRPLYEWVALNDPKIMVIERCPESVWQEREKFWIKKLRPQLLNIHPGGCGFPFGLAKSEETRRKMSLALKGRKLPQITKDRMSRARKGVPHSPEWSKKISEALKGEKNYMFGKKMLPQTREALLKAITGRTVSPETREKIAAPQRGRPSPLRGRKKTKEARRNLSIAIKKHWIERRIKYGK